MPLRFSPYGPRHHHERILAAAALVLLLLPARAQESLSRHPGMDEPRIRRTGFSVEPVILPLRTEEGSRLLLHVRVRQDLFVFVRTRSAHPDSAYFGGIQLTFDVTDETGKSLGSRTTTRKIYVPEPAGREKAPADVLVREEFILAPGRYTIRCELSFLESQKEYRYPVSVAIRDAAQRLPFLVTAFPALGRSPRFVEALGLGGGVRYAKRFPLVVQFRGDSSTQLFACIQTRSPSDGPCADTPLNHVTKHSGTVLAPDSSDGNFRYGFVHTGDPTDQVWELDLPVDTLPFGPSWIRILARSGESTDSLVREFPVVWEDIPRPLLDIDNAISSMRYILTDEQLEQMGTGTPAERWVAFFEFWRVNDPTPSTPWNERMVEYFRRVETAFDAYRSIRYTNGAFTDRGRIHILFGAPEQVERMLLPDAVPTEVWYYPSLGKKFVFTDRGRNGGYELREKGDM